MAIIDPDGLFHGERLAACSDTAQLYWPRLFIASNGYGRLELSFVSIISKIFGSFRKPPKADEIWSIFEEYSKNCLVILYEFEGAWWAQFDTSEKFLPRFKTVRDEKSPAPSPETLEKHRVAYLKWKSANSLQNESFRKSFEDFGKFQMERGGVGVGGGIGVGVGDGEKKDTIPPNGESSKGKKQPVPLPPVEALQQAGLKLEDYESYMAVRKSKKQAFVDERARDKWIAKWGKYYDAGYDTAAMFDLMISSGWIGVVEEKWTKRKKEVHVMTQRELDEQNYKDFGTPPPEEWAPPDKPQGWVPCRN